MTLHAYVHTGTCMYVPVSGLFQVEMSKPVNTYVH